MKFAHLKAAAHNMADSISSQCSMIAGDYDFPLWDYIADSPNQRLAVELLSGEFISEGPWPARVIRFFADFARFVPGELAKHGCDIDQVASIEVEFHRTPDDFPAMQGARIKVKLANGQTSTDTCVGSPLKRPRHLDHLGRVRT